MAAKQAAALGRIGRLRKGVVQALKTSVPAAFDELERQTGRLTDVDDQMLAASVEHLLRQSATGAHGSLALFTALRVALSRRGVELVGDDPAGWINQLAISAPARSIWDEHVGRSTSAAIAKAAGAHSWTATTNLWEQAVTSAVSTDNGWFAVQVPEVHNQRQPQATSDTKPSVAGAPPTVLPNVAATRAFRGDVGTQLGSANSVTNNGMAVEQAPGVVANGASATQNLFGGGLDSKTAGAEPVGAETVDDETFDGELVVGDPGLGFEDAPIIGSGFDDGFGLDVFDETETFGEDTFGTDADDKGIEDLFGELPQSAQPAVGYDGRQQTQTTVPVTNDAGTGFSATSTLLVTQPGGSVAVVMPKVQKIAPRAPVRVELFPQQTPGRAGAKKRKPRVSAMPPESFDVPSELVGGDIGDARRQQFSAAVCVPRPMFTSDLANLVGDITIVEQWQDDQRADGSQVRFIAPKTRHAQRGALVMPVGALRKALDETSAGWWTELLDRYRGAKLYEAAVVGWRCGASVLGYHVDSASAVVTFKIRDERGLVGLVLVCDDDLGESSATRNGVSAAIDSLLKDPFELIVVLATGDKALDGLVAAVDTAARQRSWAPPCPVVAARSWEWVDGTGPLIEILS